MTIIAHYEQGCWDVLIIQTSQGYYDLSWDFVANTLSIWQGKKIRTGTSGFAILGDEDAYVRGPIVRADACSPERWSVITRHPEVALLEVVL